MLEILYQTTIQKTYLIIWGVFTLCYYLNSKKKFKEHWDEIMLYGGTIFVLLGIYLVQRGIIS